MVSIPGPALPDPLDLARQGVRRAAANPRMRAVADRSGLTDRVGSRYVGGRTTAEVVRTARGLLAGGRQVSVHDVRRAATTSQEASAARAAALELLDLLQRAGFTVEGRAEISVRLDSLGWHLDEGGPEVAAAAAREIVARAAAVGTTVTVDIADPGATDETLRVVQELRAEHPWVGVVVMAGQRRSEADCRALNGPGSRVRLVKGSVGSPGAYGTQAEVDRAFARCLKILVRGSGYPMIATHDQRLIAIGQALMTHEGRTTDSYEYQLQHGMRLAEQGRLVAHGETVRVHLPYGPDAVDWLLDQVAPPPTAGRDVSQRS